MGPQYDNSLETNNSKNIMCASFIVVQRPDVTDLGQVASYH